MWLRVCHRWHLHSPTLTSLVSHSSLQVFLLSSNECAGQKSNVISSLPLSPSPPSELVIGQNRTTDHLLLGCTSVVSSQWFSSGRDERQRKEEEVGKAKDKVLPAPCCTGCCCGSTTDAVFPLHSQRENACVFVCV